MNKLHRVLFTAQKNPLGAGFFVWYLRFNLVLLFLNLFFHRRFILFSLVSFFT